jgi:hypothetical protein
VNRSDVNTPRQNKHGQIWNPWDVSSKFNTAAQQAHLKVWLARALDLLQRASAGYSLSPKEFVIGAPIAASLLVRVGVLVLANSPDARALQRPVQFTDGDQACADGVALGRYSNDAAERTVVLASRDEFDGPPLASDPSVAERIFVDGLAPAPACGLTPERFAALHLGLCRLVVRAAKHIETPFAFGAPASPHPLLAQARALLERARDQRAAVDADWDTMAPPPKTLFEFTIIRPPRKVRVYKRCYFCKRPLGDKFSLHTYVERVTRRRDGDERDVDVKRVRAFHEPCLAEFTARELAGEPE